MTIIIMLELRFQSSLRLVNCWWAFIH